VDPEVGRGSRILRHYLGADFYRGGKLEELAIKLVNAVGTLRIALQAVFRIDPDSVGASVDNHAKLGALAQHE